MKFPSNLGSFLKCPVPSECETSVSLSCSLTGDLIYDVVTIAPSLSACSGSLHVESRLYSVLVMLSSFYESSFSNDELYLTALLNKCQEESC